MRKICIINQKGGVGKTTTAVNLAAGLSRKGKNVLLVDIDPQGNVSHSLDMQKRKGLYDFLTGQCSYVDSLITLGANLDVIYSSENLTKLNAQLAKTSTTTLIQNRFKDINGYDYLIFDCAPSLGLLNQNVMRFCNEAIIPVSTQYLAITGLAGIQEAINDINKHFDHELVISHIVPTMHDKRNKTNRLMHSKLKEEYGKLLTNPIRINAKLAEAPAAGMSIFKYAKSSRGAKDFAQLVETIMKTEPKTEKVNTPISMRVQSMMADVEVED